MASTVTCVEGTPPSLDLRVFAYGDYMSASAVVLDGDVRTLVRLPGPEQGVWEATFPLGEEREGCTDLAGLVVYAFAADPFGYTGDTWCGGDEGLTRCPSDEVVNIY